MTDFTFLQTYISKLPPRKKKAYFLSKGLRPIDISKAEKKARVKIPNELKEFYEFSYGAQLGEYKILTVPEIVDTWKEMRSIYEDDLKDTMMPFCFALGTGDYIVFDMEKINKDETLILDGFHELPPSRWKKICFGLHNWLKLMTKSKFNPFWLKSS